MNINNIPAFVPSPKVPADPFAGRHEEVKNRYHAGESSTSIAKEFEVGGHTVLTFLRNNGVEIKTTWSRHPTSAGLLTATPETIAAIAKSYTDGASLADLAKHYSIAVSTVCKALTAAGVQLRKRGRPANPKN